MSNDEGRRTRNDEARISGATFRRITVRHSSFDIRHLRRLCRRITAPHVGAGARIDLHRLAFLNEKRNVNGLPGLEHGRFVTLEAVSRANLPALQ